MNISVGSAFKKEHLFNGSRTACNRKTSFAMNSKEQFKNLMELNLEHCCEKCVAYFNKANQK
jgi:hypothetical protein